ncbi:MAG: serine hydrolase domain-containing protein [Pseudomonadota bacterium]
MRRKSLIAYCFVAVATLAAAACAPETPAEFSIEPVEAPERLGFSVEGLDALHAGMAQEVESGRVAGMVTLLARQGQVAAFDAYGYDDIASHDPMTKDTVFRIYSMTKPVIGLAMMILYEEGAWSLDDPITKYVPELDNLKVMAAVDGDGAMILENAERSPTMRELMTHTAGFGYGLFGGNPVETAFRDSRLSEATSLPDLIDRIDDIPLLFQPGEQWAYSIGVDIQGHIIEQITGQTLGTFLQERLFEPLEMVDTGFYAKPDSLDRLAQLYYVDPESMQISPIPPDAPDIPDFTKQPALESGGGGLVSTTSDYARFAQMVLNRGALDGVQILKPETVDLMLANHLAEDMYISMPGIDGLNGIGFGLGWGVIVEPELQGSALGEGAAFWGGAAGTWFWVDPKNDLFFIGMIQCFASCARPGEQNESFSEISAKLVKAALIAPAE